MSKQMAQFTKEIAGGLISRYNFFRNVFQRHAYDANKAEVDPNLNLDKDHHELVEELSHC